MLPGGHGVEEVGGEAHPGRDPGLALLVAGGAVSGGDQGTVSGQLPDRLPGTRELGGQGHQPGPGGCHPPHRRPAGDQHQRGIVGARPGRVQERPLEVHAEHPGPPGGGPTGGLAGGDHLVEGGRDQGGEEGGDPRPRKVPRDLGHRFRSLGDVVSREAVDLEVDEAGGQDVVGAAGPLPAGRRRPLPDLGDDPVVDEDPAIGQLLLGREDASLEQESHRPR